MSSTWVACVVGVVTTMMFASGAGAGVVFGTGNPGNAGTDNVIFNGCSGTTSTGTTVQGCMNTDHSIIVDFTGNETLQVNGGQARIESQDDSFNFLQIGLHDPAASFTKIILNIITDNDDPTGQVRFTVN